GSAVALRAFELCLAMLRNSVNALAQTIARRGSLSRLRLIAYDSKGLQAPRVRVHREAMPAVSEMLLIRIFPQKSKTAN
ncbi:MAG: hypothetical protein EB116_19865, partial [Betaproteobacteria bacterium]|nr:hypothetical protein [Betaproteobacteria bacterium]